MELVTYEYVYVLYMCLSYVLSVPLQITLPSHDGNLFILKIIFPSANDQLIIPAGMDRIP
jgi:hypothetical protein